MASDSKMERLRKQLYAQDQPEANSPDGNLSQPDQPNTPDDWQHEHESPGDGSSWLNKFLVFAGIFCVLAAGFAITTIWFGGPSVSPNQVDISISGPSTISAGETAEFTISVRNNNQVALQDVSLTTVFPPGTRQPDTSGDQLRRIRRQLDTLTPGETRNVTVAASLFGQQDQTQPVNAQLEYRVAESNAIFSVDSEYAVNIGELPVSLAIQSPSETAPGQPVNFTVDVQSNSAKVLQDVILRANYPFGFSTTNVTPEPQYRDYVWSLGNLQPGGSREITIEGRFAESVSTGQNSFSFSAGIASSQSSTTIGTLFADREAVLAVREPYINLAVNLDPETQSRPLVLSPGQSIDGSISYESNLDQAVSAADIGLEFTGDGIDAESVSTDEGLYRQSEKTINWNVQTSDELQTIQAGESGSFNFSFTNKTGEQLRGLTNPTAKLQASVQVDSPEGSDLPQPITVETTREPRLHSEISVQTASLRNSGPFETGGSLPPEVDQTTGYTAHFTVKNTTNDLRDVSLQAAVPPYVQISGEPQVSSGSFTYNETTGRLQWSIPEVVAGTGFDESPAEIFIPLQIIPTNSQAGDEPVLLQDVSISGQDTFAQQRLEVDSITEPTTIPASADEDDSSIGTVQSREN